MRFASLLADNLTHASIKVYLSAVRSLHIDHGLSDPFVNCLRLQRLLRGIKRVQGPVSPQRLPITLDHLRAIQHGLDFFRRDHVSWLHSRYLYYHWGCRGCECLRFGPSGPEAQQPRAPLLRVSYPEVPPAWCGGARGWVAGWWACGFLPPWGVMRLQPPGPWAPNIHLRRRRLILLNHV